MKAGADDYQRKQELTREKLITSIRDLAHDTIEKTVSPELAARMEGHVARRAHPHPGHQGAAASSAKAACRASTSPRASATTSRWW